MAAKMEAMAAKMEAMEAKDVEIAAMNAEILDARIAALMEAKDAEIAAVGAGVGPSVGAGGDVGASAGSSGAGVSQGGVDAGGVASSGVAVGVGVDARVGVGLLRAAGGASGAPPTNAPTTVPEVHASIGAAPPRSGVGAAGLGMGARGKVLLQPEVGSSVGAAPSSGVGTRAVSNAGAPSGLGVSVDTTPTAGPGKATALAMGTPVVFLRSPRSCGSGNLQGTGASEGGVGACVGPSGAGASQREAGGDVPSVEAGRQACVTPGEAASMNPGGAVTGGDAGVRDLVAACVAEVLEILLSMNPGEEVTGWEVVGTLLSMIRDGAVKIGGDAGVRELELEIGGDAGVRELVAVSVAEALKWAQRKANFVAIEKVQREARLRCASRRGWAFLSREQREAHFEKALAELRFCPVSGRWRGVI